MDDLHLETAPTIPEGDIFPYFTREQLRLNSPSLREHNISWAEELRKRKTCVRFIKELAKKLLITQWVVFSAAHICHRFWCHASLKSMDNGLVATACLLLASKVEDCPRHIGDFITQAWLLRTKNKPLEERKIEQPGFKLEQARLLVGAERHVLFTVGFKFNIRQPFNELTKHMRLLSSFSAQDTEAARKLTHAAIGCLNYSVDTTLCLQYDPSLLALGALYFAMTNTTGGQSPLQQGQSFFETFGADEAAIRDIATQLSDLYEPTEPKERQQQQTAPNGTAAAAPADHAMGEQQPQNSQPVPSPVQQQLPAPLPSPLPSPQQQHHHNNWPQQQQQPLHHHHASALQPRPQNGQPPSQLGQHQSALPGAAPPHAVPQMQQMQQALTALGA